MLSNLVPSKLSPYVEKITEDHQCGFRRNRSTSDQIFCTRQILRKYRSIMGQYISYGFREDLWLSQVRGIVQYSHWIWYKYEISWAN
jgi:hypothetical protein